MRIEYIHDGGALVHRPTGPSLVDVTQLPGAKFVAREWPLIPRQGGGWTRGPHRILGGIDGPLGLRLSLLQLLEQDAESRPERPDRLA